MAVYVFINLGFTVLVQRASSCPIAWIEDFTADFLIESFYPRIYMKLSSHIYSFYI